jgi:transcriptional regulator
MHIPAHFREDRPQQLQALINQYPFAWLVAPSGGPVPHMNPAPLLFKATPNGHGKLIGHLAKNNPIIPVIASGQSIGVLFLGPHAYVSVRWYPPDTQNVPTWNHLAAQCTCSGRVYETFDETFSALDQLTRRFEGDAWQLKDQPQPYIQGLMHGIRAFELTIDDIEGHFKLSQNKPPHQREKIIAEFQGPGISEAQGLASWMQLYNNEVEQKAS